MVAESRVRRLRARATAEAVEGRGGVPRLAKGRTDMGHRSFLFSGKLGHPPAAARIGQPERFADR